MNKEYIEREAIIQEIKEAKNNFSPAVSPIFDVATYLISHAMTTDVTPVVHGEWKVNGNMHYCCSKCEYEALHNNTATTVLTPYCPNCGAKMKED